MLTDEPPEIYLKRRRLARDYFQCVPEKQIDLLLFTRGGNEHEFRHAVGLDAIQCKTVACLAGWLWTLPEYCEWASLNGGEDDREDSLGVWLGVGETFYHHTAFDPRSRADGHGSDKTVALARLDRLIAEAEAAVQARQEAL